MICLTCSKIADLCQCRTPNVVGTALLCRKWYTDGMVVMILLGDIVLQRATVSWN